MGAIRHQAVKKRFIWSRWYTLALVGIAILAVGFIAWSIFLKVKLPADWPLPELTIPDYVTYDGRPSAGAPAVRAGRERVWTVNFTVGINDGAKFVDHVREVVEGQGYALVIGACEAGDATRCWVSLKSDYTVELSGQVVRNLEGGTGLISAGTLVVTRWVYPKQGLERVPVKSD